VNSDASKRSEATRKGNATRKARSAAARALGALGASKGGKARAKKLTPERRSEIARMGAAARNKSAA
jgi:general stress protein YciG